MAKIEICKVCQEITADNHTLENNHYYWIKHKIESVWRPCFVFYSLDNDILWLQILGFVINLNLSEINLQEFDIIELKPPRDNKN